jgi:hypothetical protein
MLSPRVRLASAPTSARRPQTRQHDSEVAPAAGPTTVVAPEPTSPRTQKPTPPPAWQRATTAPTQPAPAQRLSPAPRRRVVEEPACLSEVRALCEALSTLDGGSSVSGGNTSVSAAVGHGSRLSQQRLEGAAHSVACNAASMQTMRASLIEVQRICRSGTRSDERYLRSGHSR